MGGVEGVLGWGAWAVVDLAEGEMLRFVVGGAKRARHKPVSVQQSAVEVAEKAGWAVKEEAAEAAQAGIRSHQVEC